MIKEQGIFEEQEDNYYRFEKQNHFYLSDQQRNNITKRLPRGFSLVKIADLPRDATFTGEVQYLPQKRDIRVASEELARQFVIQTQLPSGGWREGRGQEKGLRCGQLPEGKSKQGEKIKGIIQRFRKHLRHVPFSQHLNRLGFGSAFLQIQAQNRKNIHTIESFKQRSIYLFQQALNVTYQPDKVALINQMIDELQFLVQNAQKAQFGNCLVFIQKSIDKVTREISDIRESGSYYYRKRKRNQKNYDEKELLYIAELMKFMPAWEMVGVLEIIEDKPFSEIGTGKIEFDLNTLKSKKIREIQLYVKKKLANYHRSRERKQIKMLAKRKVEQGHQQSQKENQEMVKYEPNEEGKLADHEQEMRHGQPIKRQGDNIDCILQLQDMQNNNRAGEGFSEMQLMQHSRNDYEEDYNPDRHDDPFFGENERSIPNSSVNDFSEAVGEVVGERLRERGEQHGEVHGDNVEFQQPNLLGHIYREGQGQNYESSDSSYITDEEDSDF